MPTLEVAHNSDPSGATQALRVRRSLIAHGLPATAEVVPQVRYTQSIQRIIVKFVIHVL